MSRAPLLAIVRSAVNNETAAAVLRDLVAPPGTGAGSPAGLELPDPEFRAELAAAQLIGITMLRYVDQGGTARLRRSEDLVAGRPAAVQRYLTGSATDRAVTGPSAATAATHPAGRPRPGAARPACGFHVPYPDRTVRILGTGRTLGRAQCSSTDISDRRRGTTDARAEVTHRHPRPQHGRRPRADARLGVAGEDIGKPIVAVANSFTEFVPGHTHLQPVGRIVSEAVKAAGGVPRSSTPSRSTTASPWATAACSTPCPSRDLIADSVEYMVKAHCADALICISNCDKITPGMLMAALRLNIPTVFVSGGPMEAGQATLVDGTVRKLDLINAIVGRRRRQRSPTRTSLRIEENACPTCGSCSGMFTANSMNCLTEALGLALPGNGSVLATHTARSALYEAAGATVVEHGPALLRAGRRLGAAAQRSPRTAAFENAMALDIAMGGSTNTVLHLLAAAQEAGVDFT